MEYHKKKCEAKLEGHESLALCVYASNNRLFAATKSTDKSITVWDLTNYENKVEIIGHTNSVTGVSFTNDDKFIISSSDDKSVRQWNVNTVDLYLILFTHFQKFCSVFITKDDKFVITSSEDCAVHVWNLKENIKKAVLSGMMSVNDDISEHQVAFSLLE